MAKVFDSTDYDTTIKASKLDENGIDCIPLELSRWESDMYTSDFFRLTAKIDGDTEVIQFGNQKLGKLFTDNWAELKGKLINLSRVGDGMTAKYIVKVQE